jgi:FkbM family methyltransferase
MFSKPYPGSSYITTKYGPFYFFKNDDPIGRSLAQYGEWAAHEIKLLCTFLGPGSTAIDIGANVGTHTVAFARRVGLTGSVFSFEPQPVVFSVLETNVAAHKLTNVRTVLGGLGSVSGEMVVPPVDYMGPANIGAVRLLHVADGREGDHVPIMTLDGYDLSKCHLVKVDAEGMEADVLAGMAATIERLRPVVAFECNEVKDGVPLFQDKVWRDYGLFLYRVAAFNPDNSNRNSENFFGVAKESGLLFVPNECLDLVPESTPGAELVRLSDLDTLAIAILETPRFGDRTSSDRSPLRLRDQLASMQARLQSVEAELRARLQAVEAELQARLQAVEAELKDVKEAAAHDTARLEFRAASLTQQVRHAEEQLALAKANAEDEIKALRTSSWRLTAPFRMIKTTFLRRR